MNHGAPSILPATTESPSSSMSPREEMVGAPPKYTVERRLGAGGMADVLLCTMHGSGRFARPVAIKLVREAYAAIPRFSEMFTEEARLSSRLHHPNIVQVEYFGADAQGRLFLVMEYVDGSDLAALLARGPLSSSLAIFIACEVLRGLAHVHQVAQPNGRRGLVHRDVSPSNILLSRDGAVKVSDFGIAKAFTSTDHQSTIKGKATYMSPEQVNGEALDGRSDLFAVGIVLWEMLTGKRLFSGARMKEVFARIILGKIRPLSEVREVSRDLERVTLKLLARAPTQRYGSAEEALADLLRCKDAPRDGRGELSTLLERRFPRSSSDSRASHGAHDAVTSTSAGEDALVAPVAHDEEARLTATEAAVALAPNALPVARKRTKGILLSAVAVVATPVVTALALRTLKSTEPSLDDTSKDHALGAKSAPAGASEAPKPLAQPAAVESPKTLDIGLDSSAPSSAALRRTTARKRRRPEVPSAPTATAAWPSSGFRRILLKDGVPEK